MVFVHLHLVYFSPEREREKRERDREGYLFFYMKLTGHCFFFVLSVASEV